MRFFEWTDELSVNIEEIDTQHKEFIKLTNKLLVAINASEEDSILETALSDLIDYAKMHFTTEERLMKIHGYPDLEMHKKEHDELKDTIVKLYHKFSTGQLTYAAAIAVFLEDWFVNHLKTTDKKLSPFLSNKGLQ